MYRYQTILDGGPMRKIAILLFILGFLAPCANAAVAANCDRLRSITLDHATITAAAVVEAGAFTTRDAGPTPAGTFTSLPGFCRVQGVITPSADSDIQFEVWLPMRGWNGKYEGVGNGGLGGYINYVDMAAALSAGYATSSTDTGHKAPATNGQWGLGHPEKVTDYGYRAIHETAVKSKAIIEAFYVQGPRHSYFSSCSNGGRQALMEA
jgi:feruloyl esterase